MSDIQDRARGEEAARLLGHSLLKEAFAAVKGQLQRIMLDSPSDEATLKAKMAIGLLNDVQNWLSRVVSDGMVAAATIKVAEDEERLREKRKTRV
jgi:hypothetical protein